MVTVAVHNLSHSAASVPWHTAFSTSTHSGSFLCSLVLSKIKIQKVTEGAPVSESHRRNFGEQWDNLIMLSVPVPSLQLKITTLQRQTFVRNPQIKRAERLPKSYSTEHLLQIPSLSVCNSNATPLTESSQPSHQAHRKRLPGLNSQLLVSVTTN